MHQNVIVNVDTCMLRTILGVLFMNQELERRQYHFIKIVLGKIYISVYCVDGPFNKTFFYMLDNHFTVLYTVHLNRYHC